MWVKRRHFDVGFIVMTVETLIVVMMTVRVNIRMFGMTGDRVLMVRFFVTKLTKCLRSG